jgi:hypothetical protein
LKLVSREARVLLDDVNDGKAAVGLYWVDLGELECGVCAKQIAAPLYRGGLL